MKSLEGFSFNRDLPEGGYKLREIFKGLNDVLELKEVFGEDICRLGEVEIVLTNKSKWGKLEYAYINDGQVHIGTDYFRSGPAHYIYLDIIHELVHIKQHWNGRELFDEHYPYVDRPTEVEAYRIALAAAGRIDMNREEISEYLKVPWASDEEMKRLEKNIGL